MSYEAANKRDTTLKKIQENSIQPWTKAVVYCGIYIYTHTHIYTYIYMKYIYIYVYIYIYMKSLMIVEYRPKITEMTLQTHE